MSLYFTSGNDVVNIFSPCLWKNPRNTPLSRYPKISRKKHLTCTINLSLLNSVVGVGIVDSSVARVKLWSGWRGSLNFCCGLRGSKYGVASVGGVIPQNFGMGWKLGMSQKRYSSRSVPFHYIVSVPYMYFLCSSDVLFSSSLKH